MAKMLGWLNSWDHYCYKCGHKLKNKTRRAQRQKEKRAWRRDV